MECARSKELLSEYIDGRLSAQTKALLEEHLAACKDCREEHAALRSLVTELRSLEHAQAPENFLEAIHARLEPRFSFGRILRTLFVPLRIKIPLELATVAAMAVLVFSILHTRQPAEHLAMAPEPALPGKVAEQPALGRAKSARDQGASQQNFALKEAAPPPERKREIIELALLLKSDASGRAYAPAASAEAPGAPEAKKEAAEQERTLSSKTKGIYRQEDAQLQDMKSAPPGEEKPGAMPKKEALRIEDERGRQTPKPEEILSRVKNLVRRAGGEIISTELDKQAGRPTYLRAEIPAGQYESFYEALKQFAGVRASPSSTPRSDAEVIEIRIRFVFQE